MPATAASSTLSRRTFHCYTDILKTVSFFWQQQYIRRRIPSWTLKSGWDKPGYQRTLLRT